MENKAIDNKVVSDEIKKIASSDNEALARLYQLTEKSVFAFALSFCGNPFDANDIKQDVFIKIKSCAHRFDGENGMGWIYVMTKNTALNFVKKRKRDNVSIDEIGEVETKQFYEERTDIITALKKLSIADRKVVIYHLYLGYKFEEVAKLLKLPVTTVKFYYLRAIKKLKGMLDYE